MPIPLPITTLFTQTIQIYPLSTPVWVLHINFGVWNKDKVLSQQILPKGSNNSELAERVWVRVFSVQQSSKPRNSSAHAKSKGRGEATRWKWNQRLSARRKVTWHQTRKEGRSWNIVPFFYWYWAQKLSCVWPVLFFFLILLLYFLNSASCIILWSVFWFKKYSGF